MKLLVKKLLAALGILHPALGAKISSHRKVELLRSLKTPETRVFVETGTEFGTTLEALRGSFEEMHSVEFERAYYENALKRFAGDSAVHLYYGDSAQKLPIIMANLHAPALVWLDAHGPGAITLENAPIKEELEAVLAHPCRHRVLIDDARHFSRKTIRYIAEAARQHGYRFELKEGLFLLT